MFGGKPALKAPTNHIDTLIGSATRVSGDVMFSGGLHVDGVISGQVVGEQDGKTSLALSEQGTIKGEVRVPHVFVNGKIVGDIYASERVELAPNARVEGNVYYNRMQLNEGAEINGQLIHLSPEEANKREAAKKASIKSDADKESKPAATKAAPKTSAKVAGQAA